ncbi:hypothetical protein Cni_G24767 [Canna indica]|uniref:Uncharacterized protein n=1 Tax=Canna indica TaxID=4628 RepID=A0AAQ3KWI1_9LILI|nr:hypothetical protein Cni_G24767 [Canna indica]
MHGLRQQYNRPKMHIIEGLTSIELMPPLRSTLEESIRSPAFLVADEIGADLADLGWQDCHIRSILTVDPQLGAQAENGNDLEAVPAANAGTFPPAAALPRRRCPPRMVRSPPAEFVILGKRPRSKRKRISLDALADVAFFPAAVEPAATPREVASHPTSGLFPLLDLSCSNSPSSSSSWKMSSSSSPPSSPLYLK